MNLRWNNFLHVSLVFLCLHQTMLVTAAAPSTSDTDAEIAAVESKLAEVIEWIYRENYAGADSVARILISEYPDNPAGYFIQSVITIKKGFYLKDYENYYDSALGWLKQAIIYANKRIKKNPRDAYAFFFGGGAHGYESAIHARRKKWIKTGYSALQGIRHLEKAMELDSTNYDVYFGSGLYHVFAGNQKGIVRFVQKILPIPTGDPELGMKHLDIAVEKGHFTGLAAISTKAFVYIHYEGKYHQAIDLLNSILERYPDNLEFLTMLTNAHFYQALRRSSSDLLDLQKNLENTRRLIKERKLQFFPWWLDKFDFMEGYIHFKQGNYTRAKLLLEQYCDSYSKKGSSYLTALGLLTLGKIADIEGKRDEAIKAYKRVRKYEIMGNEKQLAERFLKTPYQAENYQSRFRGGYTRIPERP